MESLFGRSALLQVPILLLAVNAVAEGEVKIGVVPIFNARSTDEPITFTFTTPSPMSRLVTEYPVQVDERQFPTLRPVEPSWKSQEVVQVASVDLGTPIYNQAQYFRALQKVQNVEVTSPPRKEFIDDTFWKDVSAAWSNTKMQLVETGALNDWRRLWEKLTGVMEPFLLDVGERLGKAVNRGMRHQHPRSWGTKNNVKIQ